MDKFIYIICIIFGILLFLLSYHINSFSIGNQYDLYLDGNGISTPNLVLKRIYDIIINPSENICIQNEFEQCYMTMDQSGGSCQINSLIGLYQTALNIPFSQEDRDYINSQGDLISYGNVLNRIFDYLGNRETMIPLLKHNNLNPSLFYLESNIKNLKPNNLYPIRIGFGEIMGDIYFNDNLLQSSFTMGHAMLMYNTNYEGLTNFITYLDSQNVDRTNPEYTNLVEKKRQLETLPENIRNNGIVCIMIDFCNKLFYAVTEYSNPSTLDSNLFDAEGNIPETNVQRYNDLWRVKLVNSFIKLYKISVSFRGNNGRIITIYFNDIVSTDLVLRSPPAGQFLDAFNFSARSFGDRVYSDDEYPNIKDRDEYLGHPDTLCRNPDQVPRCRNVIDDVYYCHENFLVNNARYSVCKAFGHLDTPCRNGRQCVNNNLYCDASNLCKKKGELNKPCNDNIPQCNKVSLYCDPSDNICKHSSLLIFDSKVIYGLPIQDRLYNGRYIYNENWNENQIIKYQDISIYDIPIYLGRYRKTSVRGIGGFFQTQKDRDYFIQFKNGQLLLIYGIFEEGDDFSEEPNIFTINNTKVIITYNNNFWHLGKPNERSNPDFITIYIDDGYTILSSTSGTTIYTINRLKNILEYIGKTITNSYTKCAIRVVDDTDYDDTDSDDW